ncbi:MAG: Smr/MutS family protein [Robiginitomaculum sp.]
MDDLFTNRSGDRCANNFVTRVLTEADKQIWHQVARTVCPLNLKPVGVPERKTYVHLPIAPRPILHKTPSALRINSDKKVRKGRVQIDRKIDLHDLTRDEAFPRLVEKIIHAHGRAARCVLVVTGKGANLEGVLRLSLNGWLGHESIRPFIASYAGAHIRHGGSGAFYVFLKRKS